MSRPGGATSLAAVRSEAMRVRSERAKARAKARAKKLNAESDSKPEPLPAAPMKPASSAGVLADARMERLLQRASKAHDAAEHYRSLHESRMPIEAAEVPGEGHEEVARPRRKRDRGAFDGSGESEPMELEDRSKQQRVRDRVAYLDDREAAFIDPRTTFDLGQKP
eukprot:scaffold764_cov248-Pinguiococcus_pyrenoidosus.AAC.1